MDGLDLVPVEPGLGQVHLDILDPPNPRVGPYYRRKPRPVKMKISWFENKQPPVTRSPRILKVKK